MPFHNHFPVDPECPEVIRHHQSDDDPMNALCGCMDEIQDDWDKRHLSQCERCREFGCANIEVVD